MSILLTDPKYRYNYLDRENYWNSSSKLSWHIGNYRNIYIAIKIHPIAYFSDITESW